MLTAHLPSGYLLYRAQPVQALPVLAAALVGAVLPDIDMIFFYLVDHRAIHHHRYWVHVPLFWAGVAALVLPLLYRRGWHWPGLVFFAAIGLHMVLDSIGGGIMWGAPFDTRLHALVTVPASQSHWVLSFILHWTFLAELMIWGAALTLFLRRSRA
ncbi:metal-dependent hydrolase [Actibacterium sp. XHP0104]|uniref:metal-dependent hydrolase n=1 Tax=Actibacterium sp. XHP0104 TaxID=2984335 RepID=UPI0021E87C43|nr:metal-dependent hydrolase [Actibacterium sp. XHP0104]MCV2881830.1 metal-dependent hydrolase [Actibacterium sp. XHP0104]